jgi:hypothetical protein
MLLTFSTLMDIKRLWHIKKDFFAYVSDMHNYTGAKFDETKREFSGKVCEKGG